MFVNNGFESDLEDNPSVSGFDYIVITFSESDSPQDSNETTVNERRQCWLCLNEEESEQPSNTSRGQQLVDDWLSPCRCRGSLKWVHNKCLQQWIDEKQNYDPNVTVKCTVCQTRYLIINSPKDLFIQLFESYESFICKAAPYILLFIIIIGVLYINAFNYGYITCVQIIGIDETTHLLNNYYGLVGLIGFPVIPFLLLIIKSTAHILENKIIKQWLRYYKILPFFTRTHSRTTVKKVVKNDLKLMLLLYDLDLWDNQTDAHHFDNMYDDIEDKMAQTLVCRTFVWALLLPTIAKSIGRISTSIESDFYKTLLGALVFIVIKSCLKIWLRQHQFNRLNKRQVLNYPEVS